MEFLYFFTYDIDIKYTLYLKPTMKNVFFSLTIKHFYAQRNQESRDVYNNSTHLMSNIWGVENPLVPFPSPISFSVGASCIFQSGSVRAAGPCRSPDSSGH